MSNCRRKLPKLAESWLSSGQRLYAHVVSACLEMTPDPLFYRRDGSPCDKRVDDTIASIAVDVIVGEPHSEEVAPIVIDGEVLSDVQASDRARLLRI